MHSIECTVYCILLKTACIDSINIHSLCCKLRLINYIDSVNIPSTFLLITSLIFNSIEVLESSQLGLLNCLDSVDIYSNEYIIFCTEYQVVFYGMVGKICV